MIVILIKKRKKMYRLTKLVGSQQLHFLPSSPVKMSARTKAISGTLIDSHLIDLVINCLQEPSNKHCI